MFRDDGNLSSADSLTAIGPDSPSYTNTVLQFLDTLDSYSTPPTSNSTSSATPATAQTKADVDATGDAQSVLDFLDEINQRSSTPTASLQNAIPSPQTRVRTPALSRSGSTAAIASLPRRSFEGRASPAMTPAVLPESIPQQSTTSSSSEQPPAADAWGWSSVWNQATTIVQQARTVAEEQVKTASGAASLSAGIGGLGEGLMKALGENEQAKKWGEGVINYAKAAHLDKLGSFFISSAE